MTQNAKRAQEPVRLLFEMTRDDNPRLYDDLVRFNKGTKRVNRLRFLAHEGLLAQQWMTMQGGAVVMVGPARPPGESNVNVAVARQTNQAFEAPAGGEV
jgi:hypothetical protein